MGPLCVHGIPRRVRKGLMIHDIKHPKGTLLPFYFVFVGGVLETDADEDRILIGS